MRHHLLTAVLGCLLLAVTGLSAQEPAADAKKDEKKANRLAKEKSPYLLQHAYNPVDWYPWGDEAFEKSRKENKPILLSIGYATCHWCHVMERESFEDADIAKYLNENFICVKVDREERPDIDQIYMNYQVAVSGSGGWPLNVWLTPELHPFVAGTYFPPKDEGGRPGFGTILSRIQDSWAERSEEIRKGSGETSARLEELLSKPPENAGETLGRPAIKRAYETLANLHDKSFGGFGDAPKFPQPVQLDFLLQYSLDSVNPEAERTDAKQMVVATLENLAAGGIHDQLGGGFHRYSVDHIWRIPHFEKMLYDQAQVASAYLDAYLATGDEDFADTARGIFDYVERRLTSEQGGFYSAEDADSYEKEGDHEKKEGAFFVWTPKEVIEVLGEENGLLFNDAYGVIEAGNAPRESDPRGELKGQNVLYRNKTPEQLAETRDLDPTEISEILAAARKILFEHRAKRIRPIRDDKVITSWNGMMISAFARGYQALGEERYLERANAAADFLLANLYDSEKKELLRTWRGEASDIPGFAEDYAFFIEGLLDLYECDFKPERLQSAIALQEKMIELFEDSKAGGFFDAVPAPDLIMRLKTQEDGTTCSPNSTAARNLVRLSKMLGRKDFSEAATRTLAAAQGNVTRSPHAALKLLEAVRIVDSGGIQLVIAGKADPEGVVEITKQIHRKAQRNRVILFADEAEGQALLGKDNPATAAMLPLQDKATLYLCIDFACRRPTSDPKTIASQLEEVLGASPTQD